MWYDQKIDVPAEAERLGFRVVELWLGDETVWAWHRSGDAADRLHFAKKGDAYAWMEASSSAVPCRIDECRSGMGTAGNDETLPEVP